MAESAQGGEMFYLLVCRDCGDPERPLPIPFGSAAERGKWAAEHTKATGHDRWIVRDEQRDAPAPPPTASETTLSEHVPVRFDAAMIEAAKALADAEGMTVSAWIRREVEREVSRREGFCRACGQVVPPGHHAPS